VIQHITGELSYGPGVTVITVMLQSGGQLVSDFYAAIPLGLGFSLFDQPALFYVDSGNEATVVAGLFGNNNPVFNNSAQFVTLTGYELDCTVANCQPIASR
jgi:hypothetical protein